MNTTMKDNTTNKENLLKRLRSISTNLPLIKSTHIILFEYILIDKEVPDGAKIFYSLACNLANNDINNICYGSRKYFANRLKVSEKTIQNYMKLLSKIGYIKRQSKRFCNSGEYATKIRIIINDDINFFIDRLNYLKNKYPSLYNDDDYIDIDDNTSKEKNFPNKEKNFPNKDKKISNNGLNNFPYNNKDNIIYNNKVSSKDLTEYFSNFDFNILDDDLITEIMSIYTSYGYNQKLKRYVSLINQSEYSIKDLIYLCFAYIDSDTEYAVSYNAELENIICLFLSNTNIKKIFDYEFEAIPY